MINIPFRFDIDDRKGLEVVLLSALLTFTDYTEGFRDASSSQDPATAKLMGAVTTVPAAASKLATAPPVPPAPPVIKVRPYLCEMNRSLTNAESIFPSYWPRSQMRYKSPKREPSRNMLSIVLVYSQCVLSVFALYGLLIPPLLGSNNALHYHSLHRT
jgi:hypothetical protein